MKDLHAKQLKIEKIIKYFIKYGFVENIFHLLNVLCVKMGGMYKKNMIFIIKIIFQCLLPGRIKTKRCFLFNY
jgi:hypothetical protein